MFGESTNFSISLPFMDKSMTRAEYQSGDKEISRSDSDQNVKLSQIPNFISEQEVALNQGEAIEKFSEKELKIRRTENIKVCLVQADEKSYNSGMASFSIRKLNQGVQAIYLPSHKGQELLKAFLLLFGHPLYALIRKVLLPTIGVLLGFPLCFKKFRAKIIEDWKKLTPIKALIFGIVGHAVLQLLAIATCGVATTYFNRLSGDLERFINEQKSTKKLLKKVEFGVRIKQSPYLAVCQQPIMRIYQKRKNTSLSLPSEERCVGVKTLLHVLDRDRARLIKMVAVKGLADMHPISYTG